MGYNENIKKIQFVTLETLIVKAKMQQIIYCLKKLAVFWDSILICISWIKNLKESPISLGKDGKTIWKKW